MLSGDLLAERLVLLPGGGDLVAPLLHQGRVVPQHGLGQIVAQAVERAVDQAGVVGSGRPAGQGRLRDQAFVQRRGEARGHGPGNLVVLRAEDHGSGLSGHGQPGPGEVGDGRRPPDAADQAVALALLRTAGAGPSQEYEHSYFCFFVRKSHTRCLPQRSAIPACRTGRSRGLRPCRSAGCAAPGFRFPVSADPMPMRVRTGSVPHGPGAVHARPLDETRGLEGPAASFRPGSPHTTSDPGR